MPEIRLLKASSYYEDSLCTFYERQPALKTAPYREQHTALMDQVFGWADFWKRHLERIGGFRVEEVVLNALPLQRRWALEHHLDDGGEEWPQRVLAAQIASFRPHVVFFNDFRWVNTSFLRALRLETSDLRLVLGWDGVGVDDPARMAGVDVVVSCGRYVVERYRRCGVETYLMPHAFEGSLLDRLGDQVLEYPVSFVGSILLFDGGHVGRLKLVAELSRRVPIILWVHFPVPSMRGFARAQAFRIRRGRWREFLDVFSILRRRRGQVFGIEMLRTLARSKVVINTHIDSATDEAGNSRLFEATGVGSCLVTDAKPNLEAFFDLGREVETYSSVEECAAKVAHLLANEAERRSIAAAGQRRTLRDHQLKARVEALGGYLIDRLSR
jgi:hypothetical protein